MAYQNFAGVVVSTGAKTTASFNSTNAIETFIGTDKAEAFWAGDGDTLVGGGGDDTYYLKGSGVRIIEQPGGGVDTLVAWKNVSLSNYSGIENLKVTGDKLYAAGDAFDNLIQGGDGRQQIYGGGGFDFLIGGAGADTFIIHKGEGSDVIGDFNVAEDVVRLKAGLTDFSQVAARLSQSGADTRLDLGDGEAVIFRGVAAHQLTAANFQLELPAHVKAIQTFGDEFNSFSIYNKVFNPTGVWRADYQKAANDITSYTLTGNNEKQIYVSPYFRGHAGDFAESPFVNNADGTLSIWARPSANPEIFGYDYTSGVITTKGGFSQTYGYFEMRADVPDADGAWPAFWLLPAGGGWPPELDIMEGLGKSEQTYTTVHSKAGGHSQTGQSNYTPATADGFHTYGALWSPTEIVWYVDNVETFRTATPAEMNKPMYMIANLALGGWSGSVDAADYPAEMKIDYIRAYALNEAPAAPTPAPAPAPTPAPAPAASPAPPAAQAPILAPPSSGAAPSQSVALDATVASKAQAILRLSGEDSPVAQALSLEFKAGRADHSAVTAALVQAADATTSVATLSYQFFTGAVPTAAGLDYLVSPTGGNGANLNSAYYQSFNLENRYINFAVNLGRDGEGKAGFAAKYGAGDLEQATKSAYAEIFGATLSDAKADQLLSAQVIVDGRSGSRSEYFAAYGDDGLDGLGTKAAMVGWLLAEAEKADVGRLAEANAAYLTALADGHAAYRVDLAGYAPIEYLAA